VVVRDASGHAVGTLKEEECQLSDGGKAQVISRFSMEKFETAASATGASSLSAGPAPGSYRLEGRTAMA
jgi:hypothetical protein